MAVTIKGFASDWSVPEPAKAGLETALGGTFATLDAQGRQPVRKGELVLNVMDYGAAGNGTTDDTAACQSAIDAAPEGATIMFPRRHLVTSLSLNKKHITIQGPGSIVGGPLIIGSTTTRDDQYWTINNVVFERAAPAVRGNVTANTYGIELLKTRRGSIQNCVFRYYDKAIYVRPLSGGGVHDTAMVKIVGNEFTDVNHAFYVDRADNASWMNTSDCKFIANTINLAFTTPVWAKSIDGLVITDNVFFMVSYDSSSTTLKAQKKNNVYLGQSDWIIIKGNNFFESGEEAIVLDQPKHFTISDNMIAWPGQKAPYDAIKLTGSNQTHGIITDNVISRFTGNAVGYYMNAFNGVTVVKNNVFEYAADTAMYYGTTPLSSIQHYGVFASTVSVGAVVTNGNDTTGGISTSIRGSLGSRIDLGTRSSVGVGRSTVSVTAPDTPVFALRASSGVNTTFGGLLFVEVKQNDLASGNSAFYTFAVARHQLGVNITKLAEHGLITGASASWPSFTFTIGADGKLLATPVASASGTFFFTATTQGNLVALAPDAAL